MGGSQDRQDALLQVHFLNTNMPQYQSHSYMRLRGFIIINNAGCRVIAPSR
jgi:hypothetical protein